MDNDSEEENSDSEDEGQSEPILNNKAPVADFHSMNIKEHRHFSANHYFLLPKRINGFALAQKQRGRIVIIYCSRSR